MTTTGTREEHEAEVEAAVGTGGGGGAQLEASRRTNENEHKCQGGAKPKKLATKIFHIRVLHPPLTVLTPARQPHSPNLCTPKQTVTLELELEGVFA